MRLFQILLVSITAFGLVADPATAQSLINVPADVDLQTAINEIFDGGLIEIADGTYSAPVGGFVISSKARRFTIRAAGGATVILDGGGTTDVLRFLNSTLGDGRPLVFQSITVANGASSTDGVAGGVTMDRAEATFIDCTFENNSSTSNTGGGGVSMANGSIAHFTGCTWNGNSATVLGGGLAVETGSQAFVHDSQFISNTTNPPNHSITAAGGAIHTANSILRVSNTRFEGNQAGYVGGGIYALGTWTEPLSTPQSDLIVSNCLFKDNAARSDETVTLILPTEGGAFHAEDQASAQIYNSRFEGNTAEAGGGVNLYRAIVEIYDCVFMRNNATGTSVGGFGGAIAVLSNDSNDETTEGGTINRRSATLMVTNSLIQGGFFPAERVPQVAGCLYVSGDGNRQYGLNGVSQMDGVAENRAVITVSNSIFNECEVQQNNAITGVGGAIAVDLADLTLTDSIVMGSDTRAGDNGTLSNSSGGGLAILNQSVLEMTGSTIVKNNAGRWGGGLFVQGSSLTIDSSNLVGNTANGHASPLGSAIFTAPDDGRGLEITGTVTNNVISENAGAPFVIFDDDRDAGPINSVVYDSNEIRPNSGTTVYRNALTSPMDVPALNSLVVSRAVGNTDKGSGNTAPGSDPVVGQIIAAPPKRLQTSAPGEAATPALPSYLGYGWGGAPTSTLNGSTRSGNMGLEAAMLTGTQVLTVSSSDYTTEVNDAATPMSTLSIDPDSIDSGYLTSLSWLTLEGSFLEVGIDQGVGIQTAAAGFVDLSPNVSTTYRSVTVTQEGGAKAETTVSVTGALPMIQFFTASEILVSPGEPSEISWDAEPGASVTFNGTPVSSTGSLTAFPTGTTSYTLVVTNAVGSISKTVTVHVNGGPQPLAAPTVTAPNPGQIITVAGVTFSWEAVGGASRYALRIWRQSTGETVFSGSLAGNASTSTLISLPDGNYKFAMRGCTIDTNDPSCGPYGTIDFTVALSTPSNTPNITAPSAGEKLQESTTVLSWTTVSGAGVYEVVLEDLTGGSTTLQIGVLAPHTTTVISLGSADYELKVRACESGCGPYSNPLNFSVELGAIPASSPTITSAKVSGGNSLDVSWSEISGADLYQVEVIQPSGGPGGGALTVAAQQLAATSVTLPVPAGSANIIVRACNGDGCGPYSAAVPINPAGPNPTTPNVGTPMSVTFVPGPTSLFTWNRIAGDNGSNTTYRLYVQDLSRQAAALDVRTTDNFYAAYFKAGGARYDALVFADPDGPAVPGAAAGFHVSGTSSEAPTMVSPAHQSSVAAGNVQLGWSPVPGATLYEYFVAIRGEPMAKVRGVTPGLVVQVPLNIPEEYSAIVRACPAGATCTPESDDAWGLWSVDAGPGVSNFTVE